MGKEGTFTEIYSLSRRGDYTEALDRMLNYETGRIRPPYSRDLNHAWYVVGDIYFKSQDNEQALRAFKSSLRNRQDDQEAMLAIANCYGELEKPRMAKYYLLKALKIKGRKHRNKLIYNLGNAYFDMGDYSDAVSQYRRVTKSNPEIFSLAKKNIKQAEKHATQ